MKSAEFEQVQSSTLYLATAIHYPYTNLSKATNEFISEMYSFVSVFILFLITRKTKKES